MNRFRTSKPIVKRIFLWTWFQFFCGLALGLLIVGGMGASRSLAIAQLPSLPSPSPAQVPVGVQRLGTIEATGVRLDGTEIFKIASQTVYDRSQPGKLVPVEVRARQIETNLSQIVEAGTTPILTDSQTSPSELDPDTLKVVIETVNGQPVLFAKDPRTAEAEVLMTVTSADAQYYKTTKSSLAKQLQTTLEQELRRALQERQPEAFRKRLNLIVKVFVGMLVLSFILLGIWRFLVWRKQHLQQQETTPAPALSSELVALVDDRPTRLTILEMLQQQWSLERRLRLVDFFKWLVFWSVVFTWIGGAAFILFQFPETRGFAARFISVPILVLAAWFVTDLLNRLVNLSIDRFAKAWETNLAITGNTQRLSLRISTVVAALKGLSTVVIYFLGLLWILQSLQVAVVSVVALGTIVALAASFATQSVIKDFVNGFFILLEDQYAIGDVIAVNNVSGRVENLNLRVTQLRNNIGSLITIPNSQISQVENMTRQWSRIDLEIQVAYHTNVNEALAVVRDVADELSQDSDWKDLILDTHETFGVDQISHAGILIRLWIKTLPMKQWIVAREFRRRLKMAFDKHNIAIGIPQWEIIEQEGQKFSNNPKETENN